MKLNFIINKLIKIKTNDKRNKTNNGRGIDAQILARQNNCQCNWKPAIRLVFTRA